MTLIAVCLLVLVAVLSLWDLCVRSCRRVEDARVEAYRAHVRRLRGEQEDG